MPDLLDFSIQQAKDAVANHDPASALDWLGGVPVARQPADLMADALAPTRRARATRGRIHPLVAVNQLPSASVKRYSPMKF